MKEAASDKKTLASSNFKEDWGGLYWENGIKVGWRGGYFRPISEASGVFPHKTVYLESVLSVYITTSKHTLCVGSFEKDTTKNEGIDGCHWQVQVVLQRTRCSDWNFLPIFKVTVWGTYLRAWVFWLRWTTSWVRMGLELDCNGSAGLLGHNIIVTSFLKHLPFLSAVQRGARLNGWMIVVKVRRRPDLGLFSSYLSWEFGFINGNMQIKKCALFSRGSLVDGDSGPSISSSISNSSTGWPALLWLTLVTLILPLKYCLSCNQFMGTAEHIALVLFHEGVWSAFTVLLTQWQSSPKATN